MSQNMTAPFSLVLPVKNGEADLLAFSLPVALKLKPADFLIVLDKPTDPMIERILDKYPSASIRVVRVERNLNWRFHQAYVRRVGYLGAKYDKLLTFDVDDLLYPEVMKGLDYVGKRIDGKDIMVVCCRKFLARNNFMSLIRHGLYEMRRKIFPMTRKAKMQVEKSVKPLIGLYWIYRPWYCELISEKELREIYNGEDTLLQFRLIHQDRFDYMLLDEVGCWSLREANENLLWRQLELGIYFGAKPRSPATFLNCLLYAFLHADPFVMKGFFLGRGLPDSERRHIASSTYSEFIMYGNVKEWAENQGLA